MKSKIVLIYSFSVLFLFTFVVISPITAQINRIEDSPVMLRDVGIEGGKSNVFNEFFKVFFGNRFTESSNPTNTGNRNNRNGSNTNNNSQDPLLDPNQLATYPTPQTINGFKVYRQCNYRNTIAVNNCSGGSKSLCNMGCGMASVAMVASTLTGQNIDPPAVLSRYRSNGAYIGCDGTNIADAKKALEQYGLKTSTNLFSYGHSNAATINQVAADIREKVKNGWYVFALADFCQGGCGHYFIITDIDNNNIVTSYDPYYEPPESSRQPINYTGRYPFPKYRSAFAVRKL